MNPKYITTRPATENDREFSYEVKKAAESAYIAAIWGWDEERQIAWHSKEWDEKRPDIILYKGERIGTIYVREEEGAIHIREFFILPNYQQQGIGSELLRRTLQRADLQGMTTKLAYIDGNPVKSLYERFGFRFVERRDKHNYLERIPLPNDIPKN